MLYKLPARWIVLSLDDGSERRFRFVPDMAWAGFVPSPLLLQGQDLVDAAAEPTRSLRVQRIRLAGADPPWLADDVALSFQPMTIRPWMAIAPHRVPPPAIDRPSPAPPPGTATR